MSTYVTACYYHGILESLTDLQTFVHEFAKDHGHAEVLDSPILQEVNTQSDWISQLGKVLRASTLRSKDLLSLRSSLINSFWLSYGATQWHHRRPPNVGRPAVVPLPLCQRQGFGKPESPHSCSKRKLASASSAEFEEKTNTCATAYSHTVCSTKLNATINSKCSNVLS